LLHEHDLLLVMVRMMMVSVMVMQEVWWVVVMVADWWRYLHGWQIAVHDASLIRRVDGTRDVKLMVMPVHRLLSLCHRVPFNRQVRVM
jgi:hypothetical protein